jgi:hypothetical protein
MAARLAHRKKESQPCQTSEGAKQRRLACARSNRA